MLPCLMFDEKRYINVLFAFAIPTLFNGYLENVVLWVMTLTLLLC